MAAADGAHKARVNLQGLGSRVGIAPEQRSRACARRSAAGAAVLRMLRAWANRDNRELPLPTYETIPGATHAQVCVVKCAGRSASGCWQRSDTAVPALL